MHKRKEGWRPEHTWKKDTRAGLADPEKQIGEIRELTAEAERENYQYIFRRAPYIVGERCEDWLMRSSEYHDGLPPKTLPWDPWAPWETRKYWL